MPTIFVINGIDWSFAQDLGDTGASAQYQVTYQKLTGAQKWDPAYFNTIRPYRGEADPDLVQVFVDADGLTVLLVEGIVDRNARDEQDAVSGALGGRDLMATVLDRYPSAPFTIQGATVGSDGTLTFDKTFVTAVQQLMSAAGIPVFIDGVTDYKLGASVAVTTERTWGEYLAELLEPLRWSEKHAVDTWFDGGMLYVIGRDTNFRGTRQINAARIFSDRFEKTSLPATNDVLVEGWTYQKSVDNFPLVATPGYPWTSDYEHRPEERTTTLTVAGKQESYRTREVEFFNRRGQLYSTYKEIVYFTKNRTEEHTKSIVFEEDPTDIAYGNVLEETEQFVLNDTSGGNNIVDEVIRDIKTVWSYYFDTGDTRTMDKFEVVRAETGTSPLAIEKTVLTRQVFSRSLGQIKRTTEIIETDADGNVTRSFENAELGPFKIATWALGPAAGKKQESVTPSSGSSSSRAKFRSELLGDQASIDQLRTFILDDYASIKETVSLRIAPKLDIRVANRLDVVSPPAHWDASTGFFVLSTRITRNGSTSVMDLEVVRWLAA